MRRNGVWFAAALALLVVVVLVAACDQAQDRAAARERFNWIITDKLSVLAGGTEMGSDLTLQQGTMLGHENATSEAVVFESSISLTYNVTATVTGPAIPASANVVDWALVVNTLFDGSGTDVIICGTASDTDKWIDDLDASSAGRNQAGDGADTQQDEWATSFGDVGASAVTAQCKYTDQNNDASAGAATFIIWWGLD